MKTRPSTEDAYQKMLRIMVQQYNLELLAERKRARLEQPLELDDFLGMLPDWPDIVQLVFRKQAEISKHGLRYRFEGSFSFEMWLRAQEDKSDHIEDVILENLKNRVARALKPKNLLVFAATDELVNWKIFHGQKVEVWQITIHVC